MAFKQSLRVENSSHVLLSVNVELNTKGIHDDGLKLTNKRPKLYGSLTSISDQKILPGELCFTTTRSLYPATNVRSILNGLNIEELSTVVKITPEQIIKHLIIIGLADKPTLSGNHPLDHNSYMSILYEGTTHIPNNGGYPIFAGELICFWVPDLDNLNKKNEAHLYPRDLTLSSDRVTLIYISLEELYKKIVKDQDTPTHKELRMILNCIIGRALTTAKPKEAAYIHFYGVQNKWSPTESGLSSDEDESIKSSSDESGEESENESVSGA